MLHAEGVFETMLLAMHGAAFAATSQYYSKPIRATTATTVHDEPSGGSSSSGMGTQDNGRNMPTRKRPNVLLDGGGQSTGRRRANEKIEEGVERLARASLVDRARQA